MRTLFKGRWLIAGCGVALIVAGGAVALGAALGGPPNPTRQDLLSYQAWKDAHISAVLASQATAPAVPPPVHPVIPQSQPKPSVTIAEVPRSTWQIGPMMRDPNITGMWRVGVVGEYNDEVWNPEYVLAGNVAGDPKEGVLEISVENDPGATQDGRWVDPRRDGAITIRSVSNGVVTFVTAGGTSGTFNLDTHQWN